MFNGIFDTQMQAGIYKAMWSMMQSFMQQIDSIQPGQTTSAPSVDASFASVLAKTGATQTKTTATTITTGSTAKSTNNYEDLIQKAAAQYGVNPILIRSVIRAESNFNPRAVSGAGAAGLMQLMPSTARGLGVTNSLDPQQNIDGGVRFLRGLLNRYNGNVELALAAYNAGPGAVDKYKGVPPYRETQTYVKRITTMMRNEGWSG